MGKDDVVIITRAVGNLGLATAQAFLRDGQAAEATSIYDARNSLWTAYRTLFQQWNLVFAIGATNRRLGSQPTDLMLLFRKWRETVALVATYPLAD